MKKKNYLTLDEEFLLYCELNKIDDIDKLAKETFNRGFTLLKYGEVPMGIKEKQIVEVEKEVVKEIIVEKIVEVVKEVPVESNKEVIIKEVFLTDDTLIKKLEEENQNLNNELATIRKSLDNLNKAKYMKNSDMSSLYGE